MPKDNSELSELRKIPKQKRSRERLEAILEAASEVFAEAGYEAASTEDIAERAGTSIGSLYQFFPNKEVLFNVLSQRCQERTRDVFMGVAEEAAGTPWPRLLDLFFDSIAMALHTDANIRAVWSNVQYFGEYAQEGAAMQEGLVAQIGKLLAAHGPHLSPLQCKVMAVLVVDITTAGIFLSWKKEPRIARQMLTETKLMLQRYMAHYLGEPDEAEPCPG